MRLECIYRNNFSSYKVSNEKREKGKVKEFWKSCVCLRRHVYLTNYVFLLVVQEIRYVRHLKIFLCIYAFIIKVITSTMYAKTHRHRYNISLKMFKEFRTLYCCRYIVDHKETKNRHKLHKWAKLIYETYMYYILCE